MPCGLSVGASKIKKQFVQICCGASWLYPSSSYGTVVVFAHHGHAFLLRALCSLLIARRYALIPMTYCGMLLSWSVCAVVFSIVFHLLLLGVLLNPVWVVQRTCVRELVFWW